MIFPAYFFVGLLGPCSTDYSPSRCLQLPLDPEKEDIDRVCSALLSTQDPVQFCHWQKADCYSHLGDPALARSEYLAAANPASEPRYWFDGLTRLAAREDCSLMTEALQNLENQPLYEKKQAAVRGVREDFRKYSNDPSCQ